MLNSCLDRQVDVELVGFADRVTVVGPHAMSRDLGSKVAEFIGVAAAFVKPGITKLGSHLAVYHIFLQVHAVEAS